MRRTQLIAAASGAVVLASASIALAASAHSSASSTIVTTKHTPLGVILVTSTGHTLYVDKSDKPGHPACTGGCLTAWPPLKASGKLKAAGSAVAADLGMVKGAGGEQVTYKGHPLYTFASDSSGATSGEGVAGFYVLSPTGSMITKAAKQPASSPAPPYSAPAPGW